MVDSVLRRLARDHWVRLHGTPRVTVLVGGARGRELWAQWLAVTELTGTLLEGELADRIGEAMRIALDQPAHPIAVLVSAASAARWRAGRRDRLAAMVDEGWIDLNGDGAVDSIVDLAPGPPGQRRSFLENAQGTPGARATIEATSTATSTSTTAVDAEVDVDRAGSRPASTAALHDARSLAEAVLFEALEATPATAGRFALNQSLPVRFGPTAAEVDLLSRGDRIAVEIDGFHHFDDVDCYRRDRRKDLMLQTQGFVVVRLLAEDVMRDVGPAVNAVCQVLAYRRRERGQ